MVFWAKTTSGTAFHPVLHHLLDVGAVARGLLLHWRAPIAVSPATLACLVALHDIGKFSPGFQAQRPDLWPAALGEMPMPPPAPVPRHEQVALAMVLAEPWDIGDALMDLLGEDTAHIIWPAIAAHHGRPLDMPLGFRFQGRLEGPCRAAALEAIATLRTLMAPSPMPGMTAAEARLLAWWLAGLTTLSDWLGSNARWFPVGAGAGLSAEEYWRLHAVPGAERAIAEAGLLPTPVLAGPSMRALFPAIAQPTPLQQWAASQPIPESPSLFIAEDVTGAGKTEAALLLAARLVEQGRGEGIFLALPSMATANAAYERVRAMHDALFPSGKASLVLSHSRFRDNAGFQASVVDSATAMQPGAGAQCAAWLRDDRRRAFLADMGVGTIDQALMAVLPVRYAMLRLLGLSRRVLVIDEAHAYDAYMTEELQTLLEFHAAMGGSAILLSATLPRAVRAKLTAAFARGLGGAAPEPAGMAYPQTAVLARGHWQETPCAMREGLGRRLPVERLEDEAAALRQILAAAGQGAAIAWIRNTVKDALAAETMLRAAEVEPLLFHARFAMGDRLAIEQEVLRRFGKGDGAGRRGVVVATQVAEQSLDLDFDLMVSDLAPVDLLVQRAGRLARHRRGERPVPTRFLVVSPEPVAAPGPGWLAGLPGTAAVYPDPALLWRGARALFGAGCIDTPGNIRPLVEAAYGSDEVPAGLEQRARQAERKDMTARGNAALNLLAWRDGYGGSAPRWRDDQRATTRLGEPRMTLRLARLEEGRLLPMVEEGERSWPLSEISLSARLFADVAPDAEAAPLVAAVRAGWGRWEQEIPVLAMRPVAGGWEGRIIRRGEAVRVTYSRGAGLRDGA